MDAIDNPFTIVVDSREQKPWTFQNIKADARQHHRPVRVPRQWGTLRSGDYSILGMEDSIAIERKSLADLFNSVGSGHARFRREHERLAALRFAAVVVEGSWADVFFKPPGYSRIKPKIIFRTVAKWTVVYGVHWHLVGGRNPAESRYLAEQMAFRLLHYWWSEHHEQG
jgi:DNA excision repair protein ERCC-4